MGDISSLYENTDETQAYCRDYGEDWEDVKPKEFNKLIDLGNYATRCGAEYLYVFDDNAWAIRRAWGDIYAYFWIQMPKMWTYIWKYSFGQK